MKIRKCEANDHDQNHESIKINFFFKNPSKEERGDIKDLRNIWDDVEEDTGEFYQIY